jgi:hypothetical protein
MTTLEHTRTQSTTTRLWTGAAAAAFAALLFPRVNAVIYDHEKIWQLDSEAKVLAPLVVVVTFLLFAAIGLPLWRTGRLASASVVIGVVGLLGVVAYWMSVPIALGGLAVTLGTEALHRDDAGLRRGRAQAGVALGAVAMLAGAVLWLFNV